MQRAREDVKVREDALRLAIDKAREGCRGCSQGYFHLARQHGASDADIESAINRSVSDLERGISRRELLELAAASAVGLLLGTALFDRQPTPALASTVYWGTDTSCERPTGTPPGNFYAGKTGGGTSQSGAIFNTSAANLAGPASTYMYWDLEGPGVGHSGTDYQWGQAQADAAANAWSTGPFSTYVGGMTVFADIEAGNPGWGSNEGNNQQVLQGWLDECHYWGFTNGVYISPGNWSSFFGTTWRPTRNFVLWVTGCRTNYGPWWSSNPCALSSSQTESIVINGWGSAPQYVVLGGSQSILWQYWIGTCSTCGCESDSSVCNIDFDFLTQNPANGFNWINSSSAFNNPC